MRGQLSLLATSSFLLLNSGLAAPAPAANGFPLRIPVADLHATIQERSFDLDHELAVPVFAPITERQATGDTSNDLTNGTPCKAVSVVFARGTFEPGNLGTYTGPPFVDALIAAIGRSNLAVGGVHYSANAFGFIAGGDPAGTIALTKLVNQVYARCPSTKMVVSGYSQGAQLVHKGVANLSPSTQSRINAVVLFGDPLNSATVGVVPTSRVKVFCDQNDDICKGGYNFFGDHLKYGLNATQAATFVKQKVSPL